MKTMLHTGVMLMAILGLFNSAHANKKSSDTYKGYETPTYQIIAHESEIEIREYSPRLVAEVIVSGERDSAASRGFRILANYIFGDNTVNEKIAMTTPIAQSTVSEKIAMTTPVLQTQHGNDWVVQFTMPRKYTLATLPKTTDERIHFHMTEAQKIAAIRFSGFMSDNKAEKATKKLSQFLQRKHLHIHGEPIFVYYDSPFTFPWNRRNEVQLEVQ